MTIYLQTNKQYTRLELNTVTDILPSAYDAEIMHYVETMGYEGETLTNTTSTYFEFKWNAIANTYNQYIDNRLNTRNLKTGVYGPNPDIGTAHKGWLPGIHCVTIIDETRTKRKKANDNTKNRQIVCLDFDNMGDKTWTDIEKAFKPYQYFGFTTFSNGLPGKGERYRLVMLLDDCFASADDFRPYEQSILAWCSSITGIELDKNGSLTFSQLAIMPAINDEVGHITFHWNDDSSTRKLSIVKDIPLITTPTAPAKPVKASTAKTPKAQATGVATQAEDAPTSPLAATLAARAQMDPQYRADLLALILGKQWVYWSTYSDGKDENGDDDGSFNLCSLACAARECGMNIRDYEKIYKHAVSRATEPMDKCWNNQEVRAGKSAWSFVAVMSQEEREQFGLIAPTPAGVIKLDDYLEDRANANIGYDIVLEQQYITFDDIKHIVADVIAIHAPMGSGKTKMWIDIEEADGIDVIVAVPTKIICGQQNDFRVVTYDRAWAAVMELIAKSDGTRKIYVVIDEIHNIYQTEYRPDANNNLYNLIKNADGLPYTVVIQSGTTDIDTFRAIADINGGKLATVKLEKDSPTSVDYQVVSKEYESEITYNQIIASVIGKQGLSNILVIRQDGEENDKLALMLSEAGVNAISTNKVIVSEAVPGTPEYAFVHDVDFEMAHHNLNAIVSTSIAVEGVNIQDDIDEALVIVVGAIDPSYIVQASGRFRKAKNIKLIHIPLGAERSSDLDAHETKRRIEIKQRADQYITLQTGLAKAGKLLSQAVWMEYWRKKGMEAGKEEQALLKDGIIWTRAMKKPTICPEKAELYLMNETNRLKFYTSINHQYAYMAANGFKIASRDIIGDINDCVKEALDKASAAIANSKKARIEKKAKAMREWLEDSGDMDSNNFTKAMQLQFDMPKNIIDAIKWSDLEVGDKQAEYIDAYSNGLSYEEVRIRVTSDLRAIRKAIKSKYPVDSIIRSNVIAEIVESVMQWQADKCDKSGMDRKTMFERSSSIWCDRLDKIDYMACKITGSTNWCNNFLKKYDFIELVDTQKIKQEAGVRYKLYQVIELVRPEIIVPIVESVVGNTDLRADMETRLTAMRALQ